jgi:hypothetical protein
MAASNERAAAEGLDSLNATVSDTSSGTPSLELALRIPDCVTWGTIAVYRPPNLLWADGTLL